MKTIADIKNDIGTIFYPTKYSGEGAFWKITKAIKTGAEVLFLKTNKTGTFDDNEIVKIKGVEMRKIHDAPCKGSVPRETIKAAVKKVTNERLTLNELGDKFSKGNASDKLYVVLETAKRITIPEGTAWFLHLRAEEMALPFGEFIQTETEI